MIFVFDTETTGLVQHKLPASHPSQPHLVQYAGLLVDDDGHVLRATSAIVKPPVGIPEQASRVHGITNELADKFGENIFNILGWHESALRKADLVVCHNSEFDIKVIEAEVHRALSGQIELPTCEVYCTMKETTNLLKLPGRYGYKWPKLEELYQFLFDEMFSGAHDALEDVRATLRCYLELKRRQEAAGGVEQFLRASHNRRSS